VVDVHGVEARSVGHKAGGINHEFAVDRGRIVAFTVGVWFDPFVCLWILRVGLCVCLRVPKLSNTTTKNNNTTPPPKKTKERTAREKGGAVERIAGVRPNERPRGDGRGGKLFL
jgi:hypothetical protein